MTAKEGIRVASVDRILERVRTDDKFTVKPVRYFGQRNGARHNPYAAGVKKYELNGGRFNNDATTAYDLPRPIKSRGGRPVKNSPGSIDAQSDNSVDSSEHSGPTSPSQRTTGGNENANEESADSKVGIQTNSDSMESVEIVNLKEPSPPRPVPRRSTRSSMRVSNTKMNSKISAEAKDQRQRNLAMTEAKQTAVESQSAKNGSSGGSDEVVLVADDSQQSTEEELKTPPPLLQHPISVVMPSGLGSSHLPQSSPALPMLFNKGAQCWIPVASQLATPIATWHQESQEYVTAPECYWIAGLTPPTRPGFKDSAGLSSANAATSPATMESQMKKNSSCSSQVTSDDDRGRTVNRPPFSWSIDDVVVFIAGVPGCAKHAEAFRLQEIDGEALLLLDVDQLVSRLGMKLGPAAKVWARLTKLTGHS